MRLVIGFVVAAGLGIAGLAGVVGFQIWNRPGRSRFDPRVQMISMGERVYLGTYVQGHRLTVVAFISPTATGCRAISQRLDAVSAQRDDVRVRVIDIGSPTSEVARQYGIDKVPQLWLYRDGKQLTDDTDTVWQILESPQ